MAAEGVDEAPLLDTLDWVVLSLVVAVAVYFAVNKFKKPGQAR